MGGNKSNFSCLCVADFLISAQQTKPDNIVLLVLYADNSPIKHNINSGFA